MSFISRNAKETKSFHRWDVAFPASLRHGHCRAVSTASGTTIEYINRGDWYESKIDQAFDNSAPGFLSTVARGVNTWCKAKQPRNAHVFDTRVWHIANMVSTPDSVYVLEDGTLVYLGFNTPPGMAPMTAVVGSALASSLDEFVARLAMVPIEIGFRPHHEVMASLQDMIYSYRREMTSNYGAATVESIALGLIELAVGDDFDKGTSPNEDFYLCVYNALSVKLKDILNSWRRHSAMYDWSARLAGMPTQPAVWGAPTGTHPWPSEPCEIERGYAVADIESEFPTDTPKTQPIFTRFIEAFNAKALIAIPVGYTQNTVNLWVDDAGYIINLNGGQVLLTDAIEILGQSDRLPSGYYFTIRDEVDKYPDWLVDEQGQFVTQRATADTGCLAVIKHISIEIGGYIEIKIHYRDSSNELKIHKFRQLASLHGFNEISSLRLDAVEKFYKNLDAKLSALQEKKSFCFPKSARQASAWLSQCLLSA